MKKNKKFMKETPVIETKEEAVIPGSVGEFIEVLKQLPKDGLINLGDGVTVNYDNDELIINQKVPMPVAECMDCKDEYTCSEECNNESEDDLMKTHLVGLSYENPKLLNQLRNTSTDTILDMPIMTPNCDEICFASS